MKRAKSLFNQIISYENVRLAWLKARRHKTSKNVVKNFSKNVNKNLLIVQKNLKSKPAILSSYSQFTIYEPKERLISVVPFIDRVMHHAIMNVLEPVFEKQFIFHTYACRKGKGSHKAIKYAFSKAKNCEYFLKLDVKKYFDNIDHQILKQKLVRIIKDKECLDLLFDIIDSFSTEKGLPIGNLTSQFFANLYLSELDHFVLEKLKPSGYCRYMDDFLLFCNSKTELLKMYSKIESFCYEKLLLNLKPFIFGKCKDGIAFLGYKITCKDVDLLQKSKKRKKQKLKSINYEFENNLISKSKYVERVKCLFSF
ncbi:MAG: reverse transcriptase/maturase family protein [Treponema sp.]